MKRDKVIKYIFSTILCIVLFFNLFVPNYDIQKYVLVGFLLIYTIISTRFFKSPKIASTNKKKVILITLGFSVIYVAFLYVVGLFAGFYRNSTPFNITNFITRILPYVIMVICSEIIRKTFIIKGNKKVTILITIGLIMAEITIYLGLYKTFSLDEVLALVGYVGLSAISTNLFCNYMTKRYDIISSVIYRVITTIYIYIFTVLPDVILFFQTVYRVMYPYIIYLVIDGIYEEKNRIKQALKNKKSSTISLIICTILMLIVVMLVSCQFKYGIMVIASSSMADSINKGDAIVFEQYKKQELQEEQIIIFYKENVRTVHRIVDIQTKNGQTIYYTKGDNNPQQDNGYITKNEIVGIVNFRVMYLGWGTIWINELFSK